MKKNYINPQTEMAYAQLHMVICGSFKELEPATSSEVPGTFQAPKNV